MRSGKIVWMAGASAALVAVTLGLASARPGTAVELMALPAVLLYALALMVTLAHALGRWGNLGGLAAAPLAVLLAGIPGITGVRALERKLTDLEFGRHFAELQSTVERVDLLPGSIARLRPHDLPESTRTCCYRAVVRRDSLDQRAGVFLVRRQLAYLYDPNGMSLSRMGRRWREHELVAPHWYRLVR